MAKTNSVLQERFPFLTVISYLNQEYLGIIQHADSSFVSMYVIDNTFTDQMKKDFLECGEEYWWGSNRQIPINLFLKDRFAQFKANLKTFSRKETTIIQGPSVNMRDLVSKRIKRRTIILVRPMS
jgi:hypothetical protein